MVQFVVLTMIIIIVMTEYIIILTLSYRLARHILSHDNVRVTCWLFSVHLFFNVLYYTSAQI